jgi:hypothetical protein
MKREEITKGQQVRLSGGRHFPDSGTIESIGRKYVLIRPQDRLPMKFDIESQMQAGDYYGAQAQFYTLDQWAVIERGREARDFLTEQGITIERDSPWSPERLAGLINAATMLAQAPADIEPAAKERAAINAIHIVMGESSADES